MFRRIVGIATLLALPVLSSCKWVFVGDSVLHGAKPGIERAYRNAHVDAVPGRNPDDSTVVAGSTTLRQAIGDYVDVVEPGGWLVVQEADQPVTRQLVDWVVKTVPDDVCLAWITPHDWVNRQVAADVKAITEGITAQPCHRVVRWDAVDVSRLTTDSLHLSDAGARRYVTEIARVVR